jgi:hypothetical protein
MPKLSWSSSSQENRIRHLIGSMPGVHWPRRAGNDEREFDNNRARSAA